MKPPFHEVTDEEWDVLATTKGLRWRDLMLVYSQPEWCQYPAALDGPAGCWSLVYRSGVSHEYCKNCDCAKHYVPEKAGEA